MLFARRLLGLSDGKRLSWKAVAPLLTVGVLCLATAGAMQSASAVAPIVGSGPVSATGALPSALKPGLFGPPAPAGAPLEVAPDPAFASIAAGPILQAGPAAKSFAFSGTGLDRTRAAECLAMAVYYEAASEGVAGQKAVAQVVLNRVRHPAYPTGVCNVVFQGSERATGCQFSFTCDGSLARKPNKYAWLRALDIANKALSGEVDETVGLATHYHTHAVRPYWAPNLLPIGSLGAHRFYRWPGRAGTPVAFNARYAGFELAADSFVARRKVAPVENSLLTIALDELPEAAAEPDNLIVPQASPLTQPVALPTPTRIVADKTRGELRKAPSATPRLKADETGTLAVDQNVGELRVGK